MSITQVFGWHGLSPSYRGDGEMDWVHVPDETYDNQFPSNQYAHLGTVGGGKKVHGNGKLYEGAVHDNVDVLVVHMVATLNHNVIMETQSQHLTCRDCGAES